MMHKRIYTKRMTGHTRVVQRKVGWFRKKNVLVLQCEWEISYCLYFEDYITPAIQPVDELVWEDAKPEDYGMIPDMALHPHEFSGEQAYHQGRALYELENFKPRKVDTKIFANLKQYERAYWIARAAQTNAYFDKEYE